jgi:hypothetical protein
MEIREMRPEDELNWINFVNSFDTSMFNASLKFRKFLQCLLSGRQIEGIGGHGPACFPTYLVAYDEEKRLVGALPAFVSRSKRGNVLNSMPWFGSNPGVIATSNSVKVMMINYFYYVLARKYDCFSATIISPPWDDKFYRSWEELMVQTGIFEELMIDERVGMRSLIPPMNQDYNTKFMRMINQKVRNQIKTSLDRFQIRYNQFEDFELLKQMHAENMGAVGAPIKMAEFDILRDRFEAGKDYSLSVSLMDGDPAACLLIKFYNKTVDYMTPAISLKYRSQNPLHPLIYYAFYNASSMGCRYWNWGGSLPEGMDGVIHFKQQFGAIRTTYKYYTRMYEGVPVGLSRQMCLRSWPYFYVIPFRFLEEEED